MMTLWSETKECLWEGKVFWPGTEMRLRLFTTYVFPGPLRYSEAWSACGLPTLPSHPNPSLRPIMKRDTMPSHQDSVHTAHTATTCPLPGPRAVPMGPVSSRREDNPREGPRSGLSPSRQRLPGFKYLEHGLDGSTP